MMTNHANSSQSADWKTEMEDMASRVADSATQTAMDQAVDTIRERRNSAADYLSSLSDAADAARRSLDNDGYRRSSDRVKSLADLLEQTSRSVADYDVREIVHRAGDAARRNPGVTFALAALAGYAVVRLAENRRHDTDRRRLS